MLKSRVTLLPRLAALYRLCHAWTFPQSSRCTPSCHRATLHSTRGDLKHSYAYHATHTTHPPRHEASRLVAFRPSGRVACPAVHHQRQATALNAFPSARSFTPPTITSNDMGDGNDFTAGRTVRPTYSPGQKFTGHRADIVGRKWLK